MSTDEQSYFPVLDSNRIDGTVLDTYGMTEPLSRRWTTGRPLPVRLVLTQGAGFCIELGPHMFDLSLRRGAALGHRRLRPRYRHREGPATTTTTRRGGPEKKKEDLTMSDQRDDATPESYFLARLEAADGREWFSLHLTERGRRAPTEGGRRAAWGIGFNPDGEPAGGFSALRRRGSRGARTQGVRRTSGGVVDVPGHRRGVRCLEMAD